jgi:hypothetical protein
VTVAKDWVRTFWDTAKKVPEAAFFGGKIITRFETPPPRWIAENARWLRSCTHYDQGEVPTFLSDRTALFIGANMAFRREVFDQGWRFRVDLGPVGDDRKAGAQHGGQEGELESRLLEAGFRGRYVPESVVYHREHAYRQTRSFVRWHYRNLGREIRLREGILPHCSCWLGMPRYLWREAFGHAMRSWLHRWRRPSEIWLRADCDFARTVGEMREWRRQLQRKPASHE